MSAEKSGQPDPAKGRASNDDDLLANAIPIDASELEEVEDEQPAESAAGGSGGRGGGGARKSADPDAIEIDDDPDAADARIHMFERARAQEKPWKRQPTTTGQGAVHMKTFVAKLRPDAIEHLDEQINDWLDAHPDYEVKFTTATIGLLKGKISEEALFLNVWV